MIGGFVMTSETGAVDVLAALGGVRCRNFIFGEDRREGAFRNTSAAVNAGVRVDVDHGETIGRVAGNDTFDRANFDASTIANTEAGNNMSHFYSPFRDYW